MGAGLWVSIPGVEVELSLRFVERDHVMEVTSVVVLVAWRSEVVRMKGNLRTVHQPKTVDKEAAKRRGQDLTVLEGIAEQGAVRNFRGERRWHLGTTS